MFECSPYQSLWLQTQRKIDARKFSIKKSLLPSTNYIVSLVLFKCTLSEDSLFELGMLITCSNVLEMVHFDDCGLYSKDLDCLLSASTTIKNSKKPFIKQLSLCCNNVSQQFVE